MSNTVATIYYHNHRAIEIYQSFDLPSSAPLLKSAYIQKARMCIQQSDFEHAKHCFELVMHLFMEVKFENYEDIAVVRTEYGRLMAQCGESHEAALLFQQSIDVYRRRRGEDGWVSIEVAENLLERAAALIDLKVLYCGLYYIVSYMYIVFFYCLLFIYYKLDCIHIYLCTIYIYIYQYILIDMISYVYAPLIIYIYMNCVCSYLLYYMLTITYTLSALLVGIR